MTMLTPKALLQRMQTILKAVCWPSTSNKIFGDSVYIVPAFPIQQLSQVVTPMALVVDDGEVSHAEHPALVTQNFSLLLFVENVQHNLGEGAIVGKNRITNYSSGAGTKDILDVVLETLMTDTTLTTPGLHVKNRTRPTLVASNSPLVTVSCSFSGFCSIFA